MDKSLNKQKVPDVLAVENEMDRSLQIPSVQGSITTQKDEKAARTLSNLETKERIQEKGNTIPATGGNYAIAGGTGSPKSQSLTSSPD